MISHLVMVDKVAGFTCDDISSGASSHDKLYLTVFSSVLKFSAGLNFESRIYWLHLNCLSYDTSMPYLGV